MHPEVVKQLLEMHVKAIIVLIEGSGFSGFKQFTAQSKSLKTSVTITEHERLIVPAGGTQPKVNGGRRG